MGFFPKMDANHYNRLERAPSFFSYPIQVEKNIYVICPAFEQMIEKALKEIIQEPTGNDLLTKIKEGKSIVHIYQTQFQDKCSASFGPLMTFKDFIIMMNTQENEQPFHMRLKVQLMQVISKENTDNFVISFQE